MNRFAHISNLLKNFLLVRTINRPSKPCPEILKAWHGPSKPVGNSFEPTITWIGQATFLIQIGGLNILTDPIFFKPSIFIKRLTKPGITLDSLPKIDVILVSHNHPDHMNKKSLLELKKHRPMILIPKNTRSSFLNKNFEKIIENKWDDKQIITSKSGQRISLTFLPAKHWSGTNIFNINKSLHGSWMIEHNNKSIYFAGDSSYENHFKEIGQKFKNIDTALLPISPTDPGHHGHMSSKEVVQAFLDLQAKQFIPMHWGTFQIGSENFEDPIAHLKANWGLQEKNLQSKKLTLLKFGQSTSCEL